MMRQYYLIAAVFVGISSLMGGTTNAATRAQITIKVIDLADIKKTVPSVVWVKTSTTTRLGHTEADGHIAKQLDCQAGTVLYAQPDDAGSYFNSPEVDCQPVVTLFVPRRQTPRGLAFSWHAKTYYAQSGNGTSEYLWVARTTASDQSKTITFVNSGADSPKIYSTRCEITIQPYTFTEIYDAKTGKKLAQLDRSPVGTATPQMHMYNKPCDEMPADIQTLKRGAATTADQTVNVLFDSSIDAVRDPVFKQLLSKYRGN